MVHKKIHNCPNQLSFVSKTRRVVVQPSEEVTWRHCQLVYSLGLSQLVSLRCRLLKQSLQRTINQTQRRTFCVAQPAATTSLIRTYKDSQWSRRLLIRKLRRISYDKCWRVFSLTGTCSEGLDTRTTNDSPESSSPLKSMRKKKHYYQKNRSI